MVNKNTCCFLFSFSVKRTWTFNVQVRAMVADLADNCSTSNVEHLLHSRLSTHLALKILMQPYLIIIQPFVNTAFQFRQIIVLPLFHNIAFSNTKIRSAFSNGAEAMSDDKSRSAFHKVRQTTSRFVFRLRVNGACWLVKN